MTFYNQYEGNDSHGKPKQAFIDKLKSFTDKRLSKACNQLIWWSYDDNNNPKSDYHWQLNACYDECTSRGKASIYKMAYAKFKEGVQI